MVLKVPLVPQDRPALKVMRETQAPRVLRVLPVGMAPLVLQDRLDRQEPRETPETPVPQVLLDPQERRATKATSAPQDRPGLVLQALLGLIRRFLGLQVPVVLLVPRVLAVPPGLLVRQAQQVQPGLLVRLDLQVLLDPLVAVALRQLGRW